MMIDGVKSFFRVETLKNNKKVRTVLAMLGISLLILIPQMLAGGLASLFGDDMFFHLSRYMDAAMQIKTGHYSYFQSYFILNHSGKIANALYGPLFAYFQGLILYLTDFNTLIWYNLYLFTINFMGMTSMYYFQRRNGLSRGLSVLTGTLYILTGLVTMQIFDGSYAVGYALFPVIAAAAIRLVNEKEHPVKVWELVIGMTLLAQTHMMSLLLGIILYFLAFIFFTLRYYKERAYYVEQVKKISFAALLVLLLNFNIWGGYLEVTLSSNPLVMPFNPTALFRSAGLYFSNPGILTFGYCTAVFIVIVISFLASLVYFKKVSMGVRFALLVSILVGLITFGYINLSGIPGATSFQFYIRFGVIAYPLAIYVLGQMIKRDKKAILLVFANYKIKLAT